MLCNRLLSRGFIGSSAKCLVKSALTHVTQGATVRLIRRISVFSTSEPNGNGSNDAWLKAVSEAEKIVGFPTSFLSLRALLSDEFGGLAIHLRKLVSTKHPLLNTARGIVFDSKNYMQTRGLVVLLISKAAGHARLEAKFNAADMHKKQRSLAEITELIHIAFLVHRGIVDVTQVSKQQNASKADLEFGNKMAVLGGDFLLANACTCLAELHDTSIVDLMSSSIEDMSNAFIMIPETGPINEENGLENIPVKESEWENIIHLAHGSLLSNACHAAMRLYVEDPEITKAMVKFASNLALAQQARHDILRFDSLRALEQRPDFCSLCTLPVAALAAKSGGRDWLQSFVLPVEGSKDLRINAEHLYITLSADSYALSRAQSLCEEYIDNATNWLKIFPKSDARDALYNIVNSIIR